MGALRLFLAALVALGHWQLGALSPRGVALPSGLWLGFNLYYAVLFFYVISGFLITYTLSRNYEASAGGAIRFYGKRAVRIFALYWPLCLVALLILPAARHVLLTAPAIDRFTSLFLLGADWRWSFGQPGGQYVGATMPGLPQAWSLGAELSFYLMAPWLMRSWRLAAALLLASIAVRTAFVITLGPQPRDLWTYTFFPSTLLFFLIGHFAARAGERWRRLSAPRVGVALTALGLIDMAAVPAGAVDALNFAAVFDSARFWTSVALVAAGMPGLFNATKDSRALNWMGDLSYPLYLVHVMVVVLVAGHVADFSTAESSMIFLLAALGASIAARCLLELPATKLMRRALSAAGPRPPQAAPRGPASRRPDGAPGAHTAPRRA